MRRACVVLGIPSDSGEKTLKEAYLAKVTEMHPDKGGSVDEADV